MVVETLCHTDVSIPTRVLEQVCAQFPGVPPDPDWPYESEIVKVFLPVSALNRLKLITQVANHQYAIIAAVLDFLDDPAGIGRRVR